MDDWLHRALANPGRGATVEVRGCPIHYRIWDAPDPAAPARDLLLLHGRNANLHWWAPLAPLLATSGRVVAMDSGGAGDSGWRDRYSIGLYVHEVLAVAEAAGLRRPALFAHSFGGYVATQAVAAGGGCWDGLVILDTRMARLAGEIEAQINLAERPRRVYADRVTILSRFRFMPEQAEVTGAYRDYLAGHAIRETPAGWTWKFDGRAVDMIDMEGLRAARPLPEAIARMTGPLGYIHGAESRLIRKADTDYATSLSPRMRVERIEGAGHHIMVDQPLRLIDTLNGMLGAAPPVDSPTT